MNQVFFDSTTKKARKEAHPKNIEQVRDFREIVLVGTEPESIAVVPNGTTFKIRQLLNGAYIYLLSNWVK